MSIGTKFTTPTSRATFMSSGSKPARFRQSNTTENFVSLWRTAIFSNLAHVFEAHSNNDGRGETRCGDRTPTIHPKKPKKKKKKKKKIQNPLKKNKNEKNDRNICQTFLEKQRHPRI